MKVVAVLHGPSATQPLDHATLTMLCGYVSASNESAEHPQGNLALFVVLFLVCCIEVVIVKVVSEARSPRQPRGRVTEEEFREEDQQRDDSEQRGEDHIDHQQGNEQGEPRQEEVQLEY